MKIYIDLFFLFNVIMDATIVTSTGIILKRQTSLMRLFLSSLIGGFSSILLFTSLNKIIIEIISIIIISIIAFHYRNLRYTIKNIFYIYILSTLLGGIIYLFNIKVTSSILLTYFLIIIISIEVMILYIKEMKKIKNNYNNYYQVDIYFKDKEKLSLTGFVDTGNNLYDPYQKRPIILVSNKYQKDGDCLLVPYYTASGEGLLKCMRPDFIYIEKIGYRKNLLIGFSDSPMFIDGIDVILHKDLM